MDADPHDDDLAGAARVERTGIALVHEGELVLPAPDAQARLVPAPAGGGTGVVGEVHYWFPVQVEVVGLDDAATAAVAAQVLDELGRELRSRG